MGKNWLIRGLFKGGRSPVNELLKYTFNSPKSSQSMILNDNDKKIPRIFQDKDNDIRESV